MSLVNTKLLGNTFVNDPKPGWIKINGVVLGNSPEYGYSSLKSNDVSSLLDKCYNDQKIVVVLYNWSNGQAYTKTGFNLSNNQDYSLNAVYTAFIIESRINKNNLLPEIEKKRPELPLVLPANDSIGQKLIGVQILGKKFEQDPKSAWIKVNQLTIGKSSQFGYDIKHSNDIGKLLDELVKDPTVVVAVYNHKAGIAYLKRGFDLSKSTDIAIDNDYTSFVVKNKVTSSMAPESIFVGGGPVVSVPVQVPVEVGGSPVGSSSGFVSWNGSNFLCNGDKFVPVGVNCFGLGLCQEYMNYFSHKQITDIFNSVKKLSGTCIRSHTIGFSAASDNSLLDYDLNFRDAAWDPIDFALSEAKRTNVKILPILTDPYEYYHGSYAVFCRNGVDKTQFFTDPSARTHFKNYISSWLNHTNKYTGIINKNCSDIFAIELGNELGQQRPNAGSTAIPTEDWLTDISNFVKTIAPNILILCPTDESLGQSNEFNVKNLDIYSAHFYWDDFNRMSYGYNSSKMVNKPYIIGEYSSQFQQPWFDHVENLGAHGSFSWSLMPDHHDGLRLVHGDGFDIYFDNRTSENTHQLLIMSNHFRRMRGLNTVNEITF